MIPTKSRRHKGMRLSRNLERLYKQEKCRECAVVVTRMDFAKILGKFTKVKIQYESSKSSKGKLNNASSPNAKSRLKCNENGLMPKKYYNSDKELTGSKKPMVNEFTANILKENNRLKSSIVKDKNSNYDRMSISSDLKQYGIIFTSPVSICKNDNKSMISLIDLLPDIDDSILPSEEWCIDYFPKNDEPKDDKVYDRIAAELEDIMNSGKPLAKTESKADEFPSILDILNDTATDTNKPLNQNSSIEFKSNLESSDVEAMLLGKPDAPSSPTPTSMDVDNPDVTNLIADVQQFNTVEPSNTLQVSVTPDEVDNPHSPSILDEALQKGIEEHLPPESQSNISVTQEDTEDTKKAQDIKENDVTTNSEVLQSEAKNMEEQRMEVDQTNEIKIESKNVKTNIFTSKAAIITQVVFKKVKDGECHKTVTCPKNLKYSVELDGMSVEFLGAPKFVSSLEDLQVLLQIVNESELNSLYVLH